MTPVSNDPPDRAAINRANSLHSTGPRTEAGKQRTRLNALRHGLTGQTIVLPTEDHAYQRHSQSFLDESQPKGAIETQLVQSLIDSSWQLDRTLPAVGFVFSNRTFGLTARVHDASSTSASLSAPRRGCVRFFKSHVHPHRPGTRCVKHFRLALRSGRGWLRFFD